MKKLSTKKYFAVAAIAFLALAVFASSGGVAMAATTSTIAQQITNTQTPSPFACATSLASCLVYFVSLTVNGVAALLIALGGFLVRFALAFNGNIFNSPFVQKGFGVSLSLANLGFVLGIIIIAIATILKRETYGYKKTLWRLVAMAILVNFGLVITAPIIKFSDSMTSYFVSAVGGGQGSAASIATAGYSGPSGAAFVLNITNAFAPQALLAQQASSTSGLSGGQALAGCATTYLLNGLFTGSQICAALVNQASQSAAGVFAQSLLALIFSIIFELIIAFTYFALAALLIVRYVYILILLVTLPLGWIMWIFPNFTHLFSKWWSEFIRWTFFPVAATFFIYLAYIMIAPGSPNATNPTQSTTYLSQVGQTANTGVPGQELPEATIAENISDNPGLASGPIQAGLDAFALCALMIGGLVAASSLAGSAGKFAVEQAKAASGAVQGYVGRKTKKTSRYATDRLRGAGKQYNPATRETTTRLQRFGSQLQNIPGLRGAGAAIARGTTPDTIKKSREKDVQEYIDHELKSLTGEGVLARANSRTALLDPTVAAALAQELARRNLTGGVSAARMESFVAAADRLGNLEKVTANRPDLMPRRIDPATGVFVETREEATARAVGSAKGDIIQADADTFDRAHPRAGMTQAEVERAVLALSPAQLAALGSDTTAPRYQARQTNLTNAVRDLIASIPGLVRLNAANGKNELDPAVLAAAVAARPELANLSKIVKHMDQSQNWDNVI